MQSDVLQIPVEPVYVNYLKKGDFAQEWAGKKPTFLLKKLLVLEEPKQFMHEVLTSIQTTHLATTPVVIVLPSPQCWLKQLQQVVNPGQDARISEDDVEIAAMYMAEYVRLFSTLGIAAIVLDEKQLPLGMLPLYQPLFNVARHYQWLVGLKQETSDGELGQLMDFVDFLLVDNIGFTELLSCQENKFPIGGGLNRDFWLATSQVTAIKGLLYGEIPPDAEPENVLSQLKVL
ncbi:MAG: hypothetical protein ABS949_03170 [Solibacillus sp.]